MEQVQEKSVIVDKATLLAEWWGLQQQMAKIKGREMSLRKELFAYYFPTPKQGTNRTDIGNGFNLEANYKIDVSMDFEAFKLLCEAEGEAAGVYYTDVVEYKPQFELTNFKSLSEDKQDFIEPVLTRKPATPSMKIVKQKEKK